MRVRRLIVIIPILAMALVLLTQRRADSIGPASGAGGAGPAGSPGATGAAGPAGTQGAAGSPAPTCTPVAANFINGISGSGCTYATPAAVPTLAGDTNGALTANTTTSSNGNAFTGVAFGSALNLTAPPAIGGTTPNTGQHTHLGIGTPPLTAAGLYINNAGSTGEVILPGSASNTRMPFTLLRYNAVLGSPASPFFITPTLGVATQGYFVANGALTITLDSTGAATTVSGQAGTTNLASMFEGDADVSNIYVGQSNRADETTTFFGMLDSGNVGRFAMTDNARLVFGAYPRITSQSEFGTTVTAGTGAAHGLTGTPTVFIEGSNPYQYNGKYTLTAVGACAKTSTTCGSRNVADGALAGTTTFTSATANFAAGDAGAAITIVNGQAAGPSNLTTTIASFTNATTVVLASCGSGCATAGSLATTIYQALSSSQFQYTDATSGLGVSNQTAIIGDTDFYRSGIGVLATDGVFNAVGGLQVNGSNKGTPFATGTVASVTAPTAVGCNDTTQAVASTTTAMSAIVTPQTNPTGTGGMVLWNGYISTAGTLDIRVCTLAIETSPPAVTYNYVILN